jgi:hypothetical protein
MSNQFKNFPRRDNITVPIDKNAKKNLNKVRNFSFINIQFLEMGFSLLLQK